MSFMLVLVIIVYATLVPIGLRPKTGHVHAERILAFIALGGSLSVAFPRKGLTVIVALVALACGLEYLQTFIPTRDGRVFDAVEKSVGAIFGALGGLLLTAGCNHIWPTPQPAKAPEPFG